MSEKEQTKIIETEAVFATLEDMTSSIELLAQSIRGLAFQIYSAEEYDADLGFDRGLEN